jgi:hypothetical protein
MVSRIEFIRIVLLAPSTVGEYTPTFIHPYPISKSQHLTVYSLILRKIISAISLVTRVCLLFLANAICSHVPL